MNISWLSLQAQVIHTISMPYLGESNPSDLVYESSYFIHEQTGSLICWEWV